MEERKFKTDRRQGPTVGAILLIVIMSSILLTSNVRLSDPITQLIFAVFIFIIIDTYWGTYIVVNDDGVFAVDYFFYKSGLKFQDLRGIYYHPTWIAGSSARTLSVVGFSRGKRKAVRLGTNHFYSQRDLANILIEVKKRNSDVDMDRPAIELMQHYEN